MDSHGAEMVMQHRISWSTFNKIRKTEGLSVIICQEEPLPPSKRKCHGCKPNNLRINTEELLREARTWTPDENINWSQLAERYGLTTSNRGQVVKEFL